MLPSESDRLDTASRILRDLARRLDNQANRDGQPAEYEELKSIYEQGIDTLEVMLGPSLRRP